MNTKQYDGFSDSFSEQPSQGQSPEVGATKQPVAPTNQAAPSQASSAPASPGPSASRSGAYYSKQASAEDLDGTEKKKSTTMGIWLALIVGAALLVLLLVFIVQNNVSTSFEYFTWQFSLPLGVAMLVAAIVGGLIMALVGSIRIAQLSWELRKLRKQQEKMRQTLGR